MGAEPSHTPIALWGRTIKPSYSTINLKLIKSSFLPVGFECDVPKTGYYRRQVQAIKRELGVSRTKHRLLAVWYNVVAVACNRPIPVKFVAYIKAMSPFVYNKFVNSENLTRVLEHVLWNQNFRMNMFCHISQLHRLKLCNYLTCPGPHTKISFRASNVCVHLLK